nr:MAG TPA: hypothetical protein [Caudoviricetes sp.]
MVLLTRSLSPRPCRSGYTGAVHATERNQHAIRSQNR